MCPTVHTAIRSVTFVREVRLKRLHHPDRLYTFKSRAIHASLTSAATFAFRFCALRLDASIVVYPAGALLLQQYDPLFYRP